MASRNYTPLHAEATAIYFIAKIYLLGVQFNCCWQEMPELPLVKAYSQYVWVVAVR